MEDLPSRCDSHFAKFNIESINVEKKAEEKKNPNVFQF